MLGITALTLCGMLFAFLLQHADQAAVVYAQKAEETTIKNSLSVQGTLEPIRKSSIAAADACCVKACYVNPGEEVTIGDPLLYVERVSFRNENWISAVSSYLEQMPTGNIQNGTVLYADMNGVITDCAETGDILYPAQAGVTIGDFSKGCILIEVPELYAAGLAAGQLAEATPVSAQDVLIKGELTEIDSRVTEKNAILEQDVDRVVECRVTVSDIQGLRPGTSMDVSIVTDSVLDAVVVPYAAVRQLEDSEYVFVASQTGIEKREIETGYHLSSGIHIKRGVHRGEWVLTDAEIPQDISNGLRVIPA